MILVTFQPGVTRSRTAPGRRRFTVIHQKSRGRTVAALAIAAVSALSLAACAGSSGGTSSTAASSGAKEFSVLLTNENSSPKVFDALNANECKAADAALPYTLSQTP